MPAMEPVKTAEIPPPAPAPEKTAEAPQSPAANSQAERSKRSGTRSLRTDLTIGSLGTGQTGVNIPS